MARLKARDNTTNWLYLAGVWAVIAVTITSGIAIEGYIEQTAVSPYWKIPLLIVTTLIIGASQHQLGGVIHEGTHFLLFENRRLNELASDWLAAFAIYTTTYQYRVHHLAHHQFVNDPERDPDISQLKDSDHWLDFPVAHIDVARKLLKQIWVPNLMRFTLVRARYSAVGHDSNPYVDKSAPKAVWPVRAGLWFAVLTPILVSWMMYWPGPVFAAWFLTASFVATIAYFLILPEERFPQTRLQPVISHRATAIGRMTFLYVVYGAVTLHGVLAGNVWAWNHHGLYWILPLFTTFPLFMMIRQWVQHGNADRGRFTNTRVFLANPFVRYAIFPWGMDYHLPHHVMASVPHYRLRELHAFLDQDAEYAAKAVIVEGMMHGERHPGLFSILTEAHAPKSGEATHVDTETLEYADVKDEAAIAAASEASRRAR